MSTQERVPENGEKNRKNQLAIADKLAAFSLILDGTSKNPEIMNLIQKFGFTTETIQAIYATLNQVIELQSAQKKESGESLLATETFNNLKAEADEFFTDYLKLARVIFKDNESAKKALILDGVDKKAFAEWSSRRSQFYINAKNHLILTAFARRGITESMLAEGEASLKKAMDYRATAEKERAESIRATELRDQKLDELETSISELRAFAKVALKGRADLLKNLGI